MCGIAGGLWLVTDSEIITQILPKALEKLSRRGPDDSDYKLFKFNNKKVALGHTRLSIIDLSDGGHQPMHSSDGRYSIVFNGEIYNYREIRTELSELGYVFKSESDTEVLLTAWVHWGRHSLVRLVGMFSFVVLDKIASTLTCVRDAFGIKPFFYLIDEESFIFASEIPALLELLQTKPQLNYQRAYDYLVHGSYDCTADTFFDGIHQLLPGHLLRVDLSTSKAAVPERWWYPNISERPGWSFEHAVEQVREQFLQNVRIHLRSDVPLGAALSGGVDSSALVCAMRHIDPDLPIHTFSFIAAGSDVNEEHWVDRINSHVCAIPHKVHVSSDDLARDLDEMILAQGEPFGSTSIYAQYRVFKLARDSGITVTLEGQGADEMLAGYYGYPGQRLLSLVETLQLKKAWKFLNDWSQRSGQSRIGALKRFLALLAGGKFYDFLRSLHGDSSEPAWINGSELRKRGIVLGFPFNAVQSTLRGRRVVSELAHSLSGGSLMPLLRHGDRNSMRFSIESRVPFLTISMVDLLLSMPEDFLISQKGETKRVFRAAMRGIVPDDVLDRKDKIGFATPEKDWLTPMADTVRQWLKLDMGLPFINQEALLREFDQIISGQKDFSWQVWRWANFCRWYQLHFNV